MTQETKFPYEDEEKFFWDNQKIAYSIWKTKTYKKRSCRCFSPFASFFFPLDCISAFYVMVITHSNEQLKCNILLQVSRMWIYCNYKSVYLYNLMPTFLQVFFTETRKKMNFKLSPDRLFWGSLQ